MFKAIFPNIAYNGRFKTLYEKVIAFPGRKKGFDHGTKTK
jgi:hypothetical protein